DAVGVDAAGEGAGSAGDEGDDDEHDGGGTQERERSEPGELGGATRAADGPGERGGEKRGGGQAVMGGLPVGEVELVEADGEGDELEGGEAGAEDGGGGEGCDGGESGFELLGDAGRGLARVVGVGVGWVVVPGADGEEGDEGVAAGDDEGWVAL